MKSGLALILERIGLIYFDDKKVVVLFLRFFQKSPDSSVSRQVNSFSSVPVETKKITAHFFEVVDHTTAIFQLKTIANDDLLMF